MTGQRHQRHRVGRVGDLPQHRGARVAGGGEDPPVGTERHRPRPLLVDPPAVADGGDQARGVGERRLPQSHGGVGAGGGDQRGGRAEGDAHRMSAVLAQDCQAAGGGQVAGALDVGVGVSVGERRTACMCARRRGGRGPSAAGGSVGGRPSVGGATGGAERGGGERWGGEIGRGPGSDDGDLAQQPVPRERRVQAEQVEGEQAGERCGPRAVLDTHQDDPTAGSTTIGAVGGGRRRGRARLRPRACPGAGQWPPRPGGTGAGAGIGVRPGPAHPGVGRPGRLRPVRRRPDDEDLPTESVMAVEIDRCRSARRLRRRAGGELPAQPARPGRVRLGDGVGHDDVPRRARRRRLDLAARTAGAAGMGGARARAVVRLRRGATHAHTR